MYVNIYIYKCVFILSINMFHVSCTHIHKHWHMNAYRQRDIYTYRIYMHTYTLMEIHTYIHKYMHTDRETDSQPASQTDRARSPSR